MNVLWLLMWINKTTHSNSLKNNTFLLPLFVDSYFENFKKQEKLDSIVQN